MTNEMTVCNQGVDHREIRQLLYIFYGLNKKTFVTN